MTAFLPAALAEELDDVRERVQRRGDVARGQLDARGAPNEVAQLRHLVLLLADALERAGDRVVLVERANHALGVRLAEWLHEVDVLRARIETLEACP